MGNIRLSLSGCALLAGVLCTGCALPLVYDVPLDEFGQPTVKTIVERIQCEIRDMVRDDRPDHPDSFHRLFLLNGDYDVVIALSLEVNDSGGLAPSVSHINQLANAATSLTVNANAALNKARAHTFADNIQLSTRQIFADWKTGLKPYDCPEPNTNLAGSLGLKDLVSMAASTPNLYEERKEGNVFGGSVQFVVTKSITATGPVWQLVNFKNIAVLGSLSEVNTDKITLAFAPGRNRGKRMVLGRQVPRMTGINPAGYALVQQIVLNSISTQLAIQNQR
jgi:hypothetical protein